MAFKAAGKKQKRNGLMKYFLDGSQPLPPQPRGPILLPAALAPESRPHRAGPWARGEWGWGGWTGLDLARSGPSCYHHHRRCCCYRCCCCCSGSIETLICILATASLCSSPRVSVVAGAERTCVSSLASRRLPGLPFDPTQSPPLPLLLLLPLLLFFFSPSIFLSVLLHHPHTGLKAF